MAASSQPMTGKICMVTGATRGLGEATARNLARMGAQVIIVGRSSERIRATIERIRGETGSARVEGIQADLSSQADVRRAAAEFLNSRRPLDVLVNNVGATLLRYQASLDGLEMTWALNYLNHFLLTGLLTGPLNAAARVNGEARVVEVTSSMFRLARRAKLAPPGSKGYNGVLAYALSKRAMMVFMCELARRLDGSAVTVNSVTPGLVRTNVAEGNGCLSQGIMNIMNRFALPLEQGVQPLVHLATSADLRGVSARYYRKWQQAPLDPGIIRAETGRTLWEESHQMCRVKLGSLFL